MFAAKYIIFCLVYATVVFVAVERGLGFDRKADETMLPQNLAITDHFSPGFGHPVGRVFLVQGKAVIIHDDGLQGYWARKNLPIFKGDTIVTQDRGRIQIQLNDKSMVTLASRTKLVINESVFDEARGSRFAFLKMNLGKARFFVTSLLGRWQRSRFTVKTYTAVVGVRGSDFIVRADEKMTEVTALEGTKLDVLSSSFPEAEPSMVMDFERVIVSHGDLPSEIERVTAPEIESMKREFRFGPVGSEREQTVEATHDKAGKEKGGDRTPGGKVQAGAGESRETKSGARSGESTDGQPQEIFGEGTTIEENTGTEGPLQEEGVHLDEPVLVSRDDLVQPEGAEELQTFEAPASSELLEVQEINSQQENVAEQQEIYEEDVVNEERKELPPFPGTP